VFIINEGVEGSHCCGLLSKRPYCLRKKGKQLQPRYIQDMVSRYAKRAGIKKNVSPHTARHSFGTDLYRKIKDPVTVKNALGHSIITTTMIYVHLVGADVEKALSGGGG
jgi:site-specific recombinase XerD